MHTPVTTLIFITNKYFNVLEIFSLMAQIFSATSMYKNVVDLLNAQQDAELEVLTQCQDITNAHTTYKNQHKMDRRP